MENINLRLRALEIAASVAKTEHEILRAADRFIEFLEGDNDDGDNGIAMVGDEPFSPENSVDHNPAQALLVTMLEGNETPGTKILVNHSREIGVTSAVAGYVLELLQNTNQRIIYICSDIIGGLSFVRRFDGADPAFVCDKFMVHGSRGGTLEWLPAVGDAMNSINADLVIFDNSSDMDQLHAQALYDVVDTDEECRMIMCSTPDLGFGVFHDLWHSDHPTIRKISLPWHLNPEWSEDDISMMRSRMTEEDFRAAYLCEFPA